MKPSLVIVGLGNPGAAYAQTRHNAGFLALDRLSETFGTGDWQEKQKFLSQAQEARVVTVPVLLVKPKTFMNRSGEAVQKIIEFYKLDPSRQLLILSDDVDLPLGTVRFRASGGPGTHNGLKSVALVYGEKYPRLRIGVGPQPAGADLASWVLSVPPEEEREKLTTAIASVPDTVKEYILGKAQPSP